MLDKLTRVALSKFIVFAFAFSIANAWADAKGTMIKSTVEYTTPAIGFTLEEPYTPIMRFNNSTYFVWVDAAYRPWITQTTNGNSVTVPIDANPDYAAQADGHHRFSLGIDSTGYIHVTGDMHHYSTFTTAAVSPYPARYQKQGMMYWKSNQPESISGGFTFAGGVNSKTTLPGGGWMMGRFFTDNNNTMYYSSHVHAFEASNNNWQMAVGLYRYDVTSKTWTAIGKSLPNNTQPNMVNIFPVLFWEKNGQSGGWFQNYQAQFKFDSANRLHFTVAANTDGGAGLNRVVYAASDDAGVTWKKANGDVISGGLPLRGIDGTASTADIVQDLSVSPFIGPSVGLAIDENGRPGVAANNLWLTWSGEQWTKNSPINTELPRPSHGYRLPNNELLFNAPLVAKIIRAPSFAKPGIAYDYVTPILHLDERTLSTTGVIYGVTDNKTAKTQSVVRTEMIPADLPPGWSSKNISSGAESYFGESGYQDGIFTVRSYGNQFDSANDSFTFVYKKMKGDGIISARVSLPETYSAAGLMMRESLTTNAKNIGLYINPRPDGKLAQYKVRQAINSRISGFNQAIPATPYFLKLVRKGNEFTAYLSPDEINWTKMGSNTIAMNKEIFIGLATGSNGHKWYSETATFDNVMASLNIKQ